MKQFLHNLLLLSSIMLIWLIVFPGWVIKEIIFRIKNNKHTL
jgi:hypothetical protein